ncbi:hypothetical protein [Pseudoxanthomonas indica]|uniref:Rho-binding antiterminator n=1 Tax=Pseudoxanthomonas indica TaxID=428993 RepID=A0A1T5K7X9_9GAMM|nr:hypothetical protein [Pseudoxanthomonas indica]GGD47387.1 hypothetical protein GCM10007235_19130 [Pseudoxanthomonas indica]SKC59734.1 Rho-binding antiterminator [Pseudoxanthomonas indica]
MSAYSTYQPINCEFHDVLESVAVRRTVALIRYLDDDGLQASLQSRIADVYSLQGAEYLRLASGERIRLDQLLSIDGVQLASFPTD